MITEEEYALGPWVRSPKARSLDRPPHQEPIPSHPGKVRLWSIRDSYAGPVIRVQDWDGCEAEVLGPAPKERDLLDEPAPDGPPPTAEARRSEVLARLRLGGWVDGTQLATEGCGGSEGLRRLRELRDPGGFRIIKRHNPEPGTTTWQYRLIEHRPDCEDDHPTDTDCDWQLLEEKR